jgi:hypothetical protein
VSAYTAPGLPQESLERDGTRTSLLAKPSPNPDDAGPIVRRPMGLPVVSSCDRAWTQTQNLSSSTASIEMQCLRPLRHSGGLSGVFMNACMICVYVRVCVFTKVCACERACKPYSGSCPSINLVLGANSHGWAKLLIAAGSFIVRTGRRVTVALFYYPRGPLHTVNNLSLDTWNSRGIHRNSC